MRCPLTALKYKSTDFSKDSTLLPRILSLTMPEIAPYFRRVLDYAKDSALLPKGVPSLTMPKNERKTNIIVIDCGSGSQGQAEEKLG